MAVSATDPVILDERFDSWGALDPGWTIWNGTKTSIDTYFDVQDRELVASNHIKWPLPSGDYTDATASWSSLVSYAGGLVVSFNVRLPDGLGQQSGYTGSVFRITLTDVAGNVAVSIRFGSPDWPGAPTSINPPGFAYDDGTQWILLADLAGGWHSVSIVLEKGQTTWTAYYDGAASAGLRYATPVSDAPDVSKIVFANGLKEEVQRIAVDDLKVFEGTDPGAWNTPPLAHFSLRPSVGDALTAFAVDASSSTDRQDLPGALSFRWDWEDDGVYDTISAVGPTASPVYPSAGVYRIRLEATDAGGLTGETTRLVVVKDYVTAFLMESFSSWSDVKANWELANGTWFQPCGHPYCPPTSGIWNYFDVRDGGMFIGSAYVSTSTGLPSTRSNAVVNWTRGATYSRTLETHVQVYLPEDPTIVVPMGLSGGASLSIFWYDASGAVPLSLRIAFTPAYEWALFDGATGAELLTASPGWHQIALRMTKGASSSELVVDGTVHESPALAGGEAFDVSKIQLLNAFFEGYRGMVIDNVAVGETYPPGANTRPVARLEVAPTLGSAETVFEMDASSSSDPEDPPPALVVRWDWQGDGGFDTEWTTTKTASHRFPTAGVYEVTVEVRDTGGLTSRASRSVTVDTVPPVADAGPDLTTYVGVAVTFDGTASYDASGILDHVWTFNDGQDRVLSGVTASYVFETAGTFVVTLTVTDGAGNVATDTLTVAAWAILQEAVLTKASGGGRVDLEWTFAPASGGTWRLTLVSAGFRAVTLEVLDVTAGDVSKVFRDRIDLVSCTRCPEEGARITFLAEGAHVYQIVLKGFSGPAGSELILQEAFLPG